MTAYHAVFSAGHRRGESDVQVARVHDPGDERPRLDRIPGPVAAPRLVRPDRAGDDHDREEDEADGHEPEREIVEDVLRGHAREHASGLLPPLRPDEVDERDREGRDERHVRELGERNVDVEPVARQLRRDRERRLRARASHRRAGAPRPAPGSLRVSACSACATTRCRAPGSTPTRTTDTPRRTRGRGRGRPQPSVFRSRSCADTSPASVTQSATAMIESLRKHRPEHEQDGCRACRADRRPHQDDLVHVASSPSAERTASRTSVSKRAALDVSAAPVAKPDIEPIATLVHYDGCSILAAKQRSDSPHRATSSTKNRSDTVPSSTTESRA